MVINREAGSKILREGTGTEVKSHGQPASSNG